MEWKKVVKVLLRILWMLRLVTPPEDNPCPPRVRKKKDDVDDKPPSEEGLKGLKVQRVQGVVSPNLRENEPGQAILQTPQTPQTLSNQATLRSASAATVGASVGATYSSNCSKLLPRSQVLFSLQWDCRHSERKISLLVLHCSDTRPDQDFTIEKLVAGHRARGFGQYAGYHIYIRRDGTLYYCRPVAERGCHAKGFNSHSIGICYEGGRSLSADTRHEDNRTAEQMQALDEVLRILHEIYPEARITGHHELNPHKACPCLSPPASEEYAYIFGKPE